MQGRSEERKIATLADSTILVSALIHLQVPQMQTRDWRAYDVASRQNLKSAAGIQHRATNNMIDVELTWIESPCFWDVPDFADPADKC